MRFMKFNPYEYFKFPTNFDVKLLQDKRICVVSILGQSSHSSFKNKATLLNSHIGTEIFKNPSKNESDSEEKNALIEGHYNHATKVLYLHLISLYDTSYLVDNLSHAAQQIEKDGCHNFLQNAEHVYTRAVLFLFSVSHIILLFNPSISLDISYIKLFKFLDLIRLKLTPHLSDLLSSLDVEEDWVTAGRPCSPRVLFLFEKCLTVSSSNEINTKQKYPPIKRLEHSIEDQIYRILRKARIITNISNNSLFAVPANQEFVFINTEESIENPVEFLLNHLKQSCHGDASFGSLTETPTESDLVNNHALINPISNSKPSRPHTISSFVQPHIELAQTKGFDDNVGRHPLPATFVLPSFETFFRVANKLHEFFTLDQNDTTLRGHFNSLKSLLEIDSRFSEGRCGKVLPLAASAYQDNLPKHYTKSYHLNKLQQARKVFMHHARGPALRKYLLQLESDCEQIWQNGRQLCEQTSLTGHHCVNILHRTADDPETDENKALPVIEHVSQVKTKSYCNCGSKQGEREDPFTHKMANYDFYCRLSELCCKDLLTIELPRFHPSTSDIRAGSNTIETKRISSQSNINSGGSDKNLLGKKESKPDLASCMSNLSIALSLGQSTGSDFYKDMGSDSPPEKFNSPSQKLDAEFEESSESGLQASQEEDESGVLNRQASTVEYLPGMIHSEAPKNFLPKFSSWSLVSLGNYSLYDPSVGLDQYGFINGGQFLLPWELRLSDHSDRWPSIASGAKKNRSKKTLVTKDLIDAVLKMYVGYEYECARGHRFFLSGPEKMFKAPISGIFKENAHKVLFCDMPLYFQCHCRTQSGTHAQLMRVYIAVPPTAHSCVSVYPRVQPAPAPCPVYHAGLESPLALKPDNFWVLRLPSIYLDDKGAYLQPTEALQMAACRTLKGLVKIDIN